MSADEWRHLRTITLPNPSVPVILSRPKGSKLDECGCGNGGEGGIRTHGGCDTTPVFETDALNHSATSPAGAAYKPS